MSTTKRATILLQPGVLNGRRRVITAGRVYRISFLCDTPGPDVEEDTIEAFWTGEIDTWGKLTFRALNAGNEFYYLFSRELTAVSDEYA